MQAIKMPSICQKKANKTPSTTANAPCIVVCLLDSLYKPAAIRSMACGDLILKTNALKTIRNPTNGR